GAFRSDLLTLRLKHVHLGRACPLTLSTLSMSTSRTLVRVLLRPLLVLFALAFGRPEAMAQASTYLFEHVPGTYTQVNDATATRLTAVEVDTGIGAAQAIGFSFVYEG